ncbi:MAG: ACT domain-containing protein [Deinococcales bacterium]
MSTEKDLQQLLKAMSPELLAGDYVFCSLPLANYGDYATTKPIASFQEAEGLSLVMLEEMAKDHQLDYQGLYRCISLRVHSSLEAVGLTAKIATKLREKGISANVIAAYFHDHIFVPSARAKEALSALLELSDEDG